MDALPNKNLDVEEGFTATAVTVNLARRQLHVSLGVAGLMVAAAIVVVSSIGLAPQGGTPIRAELTVQEPQFVRPMTATNAGADLQPGG